MPKFGYWLIEKTTVYKEVEAEDRDQANDMIEDFLESDEMDWGVGEMEYYYEFDGEVKNDHANA